MTDLDIRPSIAAHLRSVAEWRRTRYADDLRDPRNLVSAAGLDELADWVMTIPVTDARLTTLATYAANGDSFAPGQQTLYEIGRFRFFTPDTAFDRFLELLADLAIADHAENGRFGGRQAPGDEPW